MYIDENYLWWWELKNCIINMRYFVCAPFHRYDIVYFMIIQHVFSFSDVCYILNVKYSKRESFNIITHIYICDYYKNKIINIKINIKIYLKSLT